MILPEIPLLTPGMSVKQGLAAMQMSGLSSLPIVDEGSYVGVVHEKELLRDDVAGKIGRENWRTPSVREESHLFDVVNQLAQYSDDILPVVTTDRHYVGAISIHSALIVTSEQSVNIEFDKILFLFIGGQKRAHQILLPP